MDFGKLCNIDIWGKASQGINPIFVNYNAEVTWKLQFFNNVLELCLLQLIYDKHVGKTDYGFLKINNWGTLAQLEPIMTRLHLLLQEYLNVLKEFDIPTGTTPLLYLVPLCVEILT
jgi:hypothetical protein